MSPHNHHLLWHESLLFLNYLSSLFCVFAHTLLFVRRRRRRRRRSVLRMLLRKSLDITRTRKPPSYALEQKRRGVCVRNYILTPPHLLPLSFPSVCASSCSFIHAPSVIFSRRVRNTFVPMRTTDTNDCLVVLGQQPLRLARSVIRFGPGL